MGRHIKLMEFEAIELPIRYLASVVDAASANSIDMTVFLQTQGITKDALEYPEATVKTIIYFRAIAFALKKYQNPQPFSLEVIRHTTLTNHGLLSLAGMCAPSYRAALEMVQDYSSLILPLISISLHENNNHSFVRIQSSIFVPEIADTLQEIVIGFFYAGKILTGIPPKKITFAHTPQSPIEYYEELWGCPVHTNQPYYELHIEPKLLEVAPPTANPENFANLKQQLESEAQSHTSNLRLQIEKILINTNDGNFLNLEEIAHELCMSPRTFRRKLEKENCSYKQLVNETRERLAKQQLKKPDMPIGKISRHLGFANEASFSRAFKSWTGLSPQQYRKND